MKTTKKTYLTVACISLCAALMLAGCTTSSNNLVGTSNITNVPPPVSSANSNENLETSTWPKPTGETAPPPYDIDWLRAVQKGSVSGIMGFMPGAVALVPKSINPQTPNVPLFAGPDIILGPRTPVSGKPQKVVANGKYDVVRVFFGTDRKVHGRTGEKLQFLADKAPTIAYGAVDVSIPRNHVVGNLESPSIWRMYKADPERDVMVLQSEVTGKYKFLAAIRSRTQNEKTPSLFLFVHGYNVSFDEAARRTAQMVYDMDFPGAPLMFSWPSQEKLIGYTEDEAAIERAEPDIKQFIREVLGATPDANLYVVAHSMGNRGVTRALVEIAKESPQTASHIREIVLAAPDIDSDVFVNQIAPDLVNMKVPVTLYASSKDRALSISKIIHGGPRAGDSGEDMILLPGIETIDVTNVDTDLTGHSYIGDRRSILSDLYYLVQSDARAGQRFGLISRWQSGKQYWVFKQ